MDETELSVADHLTKISINRALRATECRYMVFSDYEVFHAVRPVMARKYAGRWPEMLIFSTVLHNYRKHGLKLQGKKYYELRLEWRDAWHNVKGHPQTEELPPDHPYRHFYVLPRRPRAIQATGPGAMQLDGLFLRSWSTAIYATEWAFRMNFKRIILLGIDFRSKRGNGKDLTYMHQIDRKTSADKRCTLGKPDLPVPQLARACQDFEKHGIELVNGSPWEGPLDEFIPRRPLSSLV